jgi:hypothetical protein
MPYVVLRTHGGLGNQLFQILYGRLLSDELQIELREVHDLGYSHKFERAELPRLNRAPEKWQLIISSLRLPKILQRFFKRSELPLKLGKDLYLDGYFQTADQYTRFSNDAIRKNLKLIADEFGINPAHQDALLVHLRVGDFFKDRNLALSHIFQRLQDIPNNSFLMTNDEDLLINENLEILIKNKQLNLISTKDYTADKVLRTLCHFQNLNFKNRSRDARSEKNRPAV